MTKREAAIVSAYTGYLIGEFDDFHKYVEEILDRPVFTHEFGFTKTEKLIQEAAKKDFISIVITQEDKINSQAELIRSLQEALKEAEARIEGLLRENG